MLKITKKKFKLAHEKYPPNWWIKIIFKYFSKNSENKKVKYVFVCLLILFFLLGIFNGIFVIVYSVLLAAIVLTTLSAVILNNIRLDKIRKHLGVTRKQYKILHDRYNE
ncbi:MAG: hypothetical protein ACOC33_01025 [bacterium]